MWFVICGNKYASPVEAWAASMDASCAYFWETQKNTENIYPQTSQSAKWTFQAGPFFFRDPLIFFFGPSFQVSSVFSLYCG